MFAKLAQHRAERRRHAISAPRVAVPANNNKIDWRLAAPAGARRPALACRWQQNRATGKLECRWTTDDGETATDEPQPRSPLVPAPAGTRRFQKRARLGRWIPVGARVSDCGLRSRMPARPRARGRYA
jgi:hypothetical protein